MCPGNTAHLGLGGGGHAEHSATVRTGQTRLCAPWPRCRRKRSRGRGVNGPPSRPAQPAPRCSSPLPGNARFRSGPSTLPACPWPQICPALTNIPLSLRVYGFSMCLSSCGWEPTLRSPKQRLGLGWRRLGLAKPQEGRREPGGKNSGGGAQQGELCPEGGPDSCWSQEGTRRPFPKLGGVGSHKPTTPRTQAE